MSITAREISLRWKSQRWANLLMLFDKSVSIMEGGEAVGSAREVVHLVLNEMPPAQHAPSLSGGLWDHQLPDRSSEASPPPPNPSLVALFLSCAGREGVGGVGGAVKKRGATRFAEVAAAGRTALKSPA